MPRYEVRFYDPMNRIKVAVELDGPDEAGAELAARRYLIDDAPQHLRADFLSFTALRELR